MHRHQTEICWALEDGADIFHLTFRFLQFTVGTVWICATTFMLMTSGGSGDTFWNWLLPPHRGEKQRGPLSPEPSPDTWWAWARVLVTIQDKIYSVKFWHCRWRGGGTEGCWRGNAGGVFMTELSQLPHFSLSSARLMSPRRAERCHFLLSGSGIFSFWILPLSESELCGRRNASTWPQLRILLEM